MRNLILNLAWQLFGIPCVVIYDYDDEWHLRRVRWAGKRPYAARYSGICNVFLEADGKCRGVTFVKTWEPALPSIPTWHPDWQQTAHESAQVLS